MAKFVASDAELVWKGEQPSGELIAQVRANLAHELRNMSHASNLVHHTVFLSDDLEDGPVVFVHGRANDLRLYCEYVAKPEWVTLDEVPFQ